MRAVTREIFESRFRAGVEFGLYVGTVWYETIYLSLVDAAAVASAGGRGPGVARRAADADGGVRAAAGVEYHSKSIMCWSLFAANSGGLKK